MALERNLNVNIKATEDVSPAAKKAAKAIEDNLVKSVKISEKAMLSNQKAVEASTKGIQKNATTVQRTSSIIERATSQASKGYSFMRVALEAVTAATNIFSNSFTAVMSGMQTAMSFMKENKILSHFILSFTNLRKVTDLAATAIGFFNPALGTALKILSPFSNSAFRTANAVMFFSKGLRRVVTVLSGFKKGLSIAARGLEFFVGKEQIIEMIQIAAISLSNVVASLGKHLKSLGGGFARLAPLLFKFSKGLRSSQAAGVALKAIHFDLEETLDKYDGSITDAIADQLTLAQKLKLGGAALDQYGSALLMADDNFLKLKGTMLKVAGAFTTLSSKVVAGFTAIKDETLLTAVAIAGIASIDVLFKPVDFALNSLSKTIRATKFDADLLNQSFLRNFGQNKKIVKIIGVVEKNMRSLTKVSSMIYDTAIVDTRNLMAEMGFIDKIILKTADSSKKATAAIKPMVVNLQSLSKVRGPQDITEAFKKLGDSAGAARVKLATVLRLRMDTFFLMAKNQAQALGQTLNQLPRTISQLHTSFGPLVTQISEDMFHKAMLGIHRYGDAIAGLRDPIRQQITSLNKTFPILKLNRKEWLLLAQATGMKAKEAMIRLANNGFGVLADALDLTRGGLRAVRTGIFSYLDQTSKASKLTQGFGLSLLDTFKNSEFMEKGITGVVTRLGALSGGFASLGSVLLKSEGIFKKMTGIALLALAASLGGIIVLVRQLFLSVGTVVGKIGDMFTAMSLKQVEAFANAEQSAFAFEQTIKGYSASVEAAAESTKLWNGFMKQTAQATGETGMRALVAEVVAATDAYDFSRQMQEQLIKSTIDLSQRAHKPAIDVLTALINAINGNGQSVVALGLHVNNTAIQHSKLTKEVKENFKSLGDNQKAHARYSVLMEQAGKAAGFATNNTHLYSKALKIQKNALASLNVQLGKGAEIINGQVIMGLATMTQSLTDAIKPILPLIGAVQALSGRILQLGGFLLKNFLLVSTLLSLWRGANILFSKLESRAFFSTTIPLFNKSLYQMAAAGGAAGIKLNSVGNVGRASMKIIAEQTKLTIKEFFNMKAMSETLKGGMTGLGNVFRFVGKAVLSMTKQALKFMVSPIGLTIMAIAAAAYILVKAFQLLEERTGIFSDLWARLQKWLEATGPIMEALKTAFKGAGDVLLVGLGAAVKATAAVLALFISQTIKNIRRLMQLSRVFKSILPDSMVASEEALKAITKAEDELYKLSKDLASEALADVANAFTENANAADKSKNATLELAKAVGLLNKKFEALGESASKSMEGIADLTPKFTLAKTTEEIDKFVKNLENLKATGTELSLGLKLQFLGPSLPEEVQQQLKEIEEKIHNANIILHALEIKRARAIRAAKVKEVEIELQEVFDKRITVQDDINKMRLSKAKELRDRLIEIETQAILASKNLQGKEPTTVKEAALIKANDSQLNLVKDRLQAELDLSRDMTIEINKIKLEHGRKLRDQEINTEAQKILEFRKLAGMNVATVDEAALIQANSKELEIFRGKLETQKSLALDMSREKNSILIQHAQEMRDKEIEILTQRILKERELDGQNASTVKQQAMINANQAELQLFTEKLETQKQLAISVELEKQIKLAEIKANALKGTAAGPQASQDVEVLKAQQKAEQLQQLRQNEQINETEHQTILRQIKADQIEQTHQMEMAKQQQRADSLGISDAGFQARMARNEERHLMELDRLRLEHENKQLVDDEYRISKEEAEANHLARQGEIKERFIQDDIARNEKLGNAWQATLKKVELSQMKHGKVMGFIRGIQATQQYSTMNTAMSNLASLRNSKNKKMFEVGKKAAMAQTVVQTMLAATSAMASMSMIPIVGPALGMLAAAAAIAAGLTNLQNIKSQKFNGGQADEGLDFVPKSMGGKSFILSGGERVLQPEANKDMTAFLKNQKDGGMGGPNITINIDSVDSPERVDEIKQAVMDGIREASERGEPIISEKGVVAS